MVSVGAGSPANTGKAGAIYRVAFFAGKPAPTGLLDMPAISTHSKPDFGIHWGLEQRLSRPSPGSWLDEELRKLRASSPWEALIPFSIGAGFALVLLIASMLIVRSL